ncbi:hypothetical protein M3P19_08635 [Muricauda sp. 2012CJ35-5]|uniref:Uncharacterized protein n=1 Tax=Flagellimonas spongiicola TaxID=2942208 RepID=A0ABT0PRU6_9FLAO|nr:hypothetical protein [Allomuricauda spongiicola]MCL6274074.1 hypothetical protein [Allomuricauda spongiicola]
MKSAKKSVPNKTPDKKRIMVYSNLDTGKLAAFLLIREVQLTDAMYELIDVAKLKATVKV